MNLLSSRAGWLCAMFVVGTAALATSQVGGSDEVGPPAAFRGVPTKDAPPPPPPPQPQSTIELRVAWAVTEAGDLELRLHAQGPPGDAFLVGLERPGWRDLLLVTAATLDADGTWSLRRTVRADQARALSAASFVVLAR